MFKYNPHKRCGCSACRSGAGSKFGKYVHKQINRAIRHADKLKLRIDPENYVDTILSTPPTD